MVPLKFYEALFFQFFCRSRLEVGVSRAFSQYQQNYGLCWVWQMQIMGKIAGQLLSNRVTLVAWCSAVLYQNLLKLFDKYNMWITH